ISRVRSMESPIRLNLHPNRNASGSEGASQEFQQSAKNYLERVTVPKGVRDLEPFCTIIIFRPIKKARHVRPNKRTNRSRQQCSRKSNQRDKHHQHAQSLAERKPGRADDLAEQPNPE